jgi:hypothetical protein
VLKSSVIAGIAVETMVVSCLELLAAGSVFALARMGQTYQGLEKKRNTSKENDQGQPFPGWEWGWCGSVHGALRERKLSVYASKSNSESLPFLFLLQPEKKVILLLYKTTHVQNQTIVPTIRSSRLGKYGTAAGCVLGTRFIRDHVVKKRHEMNYIKKHVPAYCYSKLRPSVQSVITVMLGPISDTL